MTPVESSEAPETPDLCPACGRAMVEFNPDEWACVHSDCGGADGAAYERCQLRTEVHIETGCTVILTDEHARRLLDVIGQCSRAQVRRMAEDGTTPVELASSFVVRRWEAAPVASVDELVDAAVERLRFTCGVTPEWAWYDHILETVEEPLQSKLHALHPFIGTEQVQLCTVGEILERVEAGELDRDARILAIVG